MYRLRLTAAASCASLTATAAASLGRPCSSRAAPPISGTNLVAPAAPPTIRCRSSGCIIPARLVQVQVTFRHGARSPIEDLHCRDEMCQWLPQDTDKTEALRKINATVVLTHGRERWDPATLFGDPAFTEAYSQRACLDGGGTPGRLTPVGLAQGVELGAELARRYVDPVAACATEVGAAYLLPRAWAAAAPYVHPRSTCVERTVFTAVGVLAGAFPDAARSGALRDVPMALNAAPGEAADSEWMVLNVQQCPRLGELFQQGVELSSSHLDEAQLRVLEQVERGSSWQMPNRGWSLICYRDWASCRRAAGKASPACVDGLAAELDTATARQMHAIFAGGAPFTPEPRATHAEALRLGIGRMVRHIVSTMEEGAAHEEGEARGTLHLYSGHDWTVGPLLMCVARHDEPELSKWPPFCANLAFELWCTREAGATGATGAAASPSAADEGWHVRVVYNGTPLRLPCAREGEETCAAGTRIGGHSDWPWTRRWDRGRSSQVHACGVQSPRRRVLGRRQALSKALSPVLGRRQALILTLTR